MSQFEFTTTDPEIVSAVTGALKAASEAFSRDEKGAVFCQLLRTYDVETGETSVRFRGAFIENEYAARIDAVLAERRQKQGQSI